MEQTYTIKKLDILRDDLHIRGQLYMPDRADPENPSALVILSHGFNGTYRHHLVEADFFAKHGIACYGFDYCGGSLTSESDGSQYEMSVLTEAADLNAVINALGKLDGIDENKIILMGFSQGGYVAGYVAGQRPEGIAGVILCYPALVIYDDTVKRVVNGVPERFSVMDFEIGARYHKDALSVDIYGEIAKYKKPMLLIHGNADAIVPISYSEKLFEVMEDCTYLEYDGAGHGFDGDYLLDECDDALSYIEEILQ